MDNLKTLRQAFINDILRYLDRGFLTGYSFELKSNSLDGCLLHLIYKDNREFEFKVLQPRSKVNPENNWKTVESPGRAFTSPEQFTHGDHNNAISSVQSWADRIMVDTLEQLRAREGVNFLAEARIKIEKAANNLPEPELPFNEAETEDWINKFKNLVAKVQDLEERLTTQTHAVDRINDELEQLRKQAPDIPKRAWLRKAGNKILDVFQSTADAAAKEGAKEIAKAGMKALVDSVNSIS